MRYGNAVPAPEGYLQMAWYVAGTRCLGPDNRFALWVQGCHQRCEGCIAEPLQDVHGGTLVQITTLAEQILRTPQIDGLSISGGEPFLQAQGLAALLREVHKKRPELGVIVYTGLLYEQLQEEPSAQAFLEHIDLLIDGAYVQAQDDGRAMRGSANQRLLFLSERYKPDDLPTHRTNEIQFSDGSFRMIGIPSQGAKQMIGILHPDST